MKRNKNKKGAWIAFVCAAAVLALVVLLENLSLFIPQQSLPKIFLPTSQLFTVLKKAAVYSLVAVSMNLLNGFTGLFSLGTAGFMALGAYAYAVVTIPVSKKATVYYLYGVADWLKNVELTPMIGLIIGGLIAALCAFLIGLPVLRLKSDYFAIATLGFAEIVRIVVGSSPLNKVTNGSLGMNNIPKFESYYTTFIVVIVCIAVCVLLINSSYGRAFKAIREDEIAAETMGINLAKHKRMSFVASSFFAGISGGLLAMYLGAITSTTFNINITYFVLLIIVIGGLGSITGSIISSVIVVFAREWWLRFLDSATYIGDWQIPFIRTGFRMVVFSVLLMVVVLFWRQGIMGQKEFSWDGIYNFFKKLGKKKSGGKGEAAND